MSSSKGFRIFRISHIIGPKQHEILSFLSDKEDMELSELYEKYSGSTISSLLERGLIKKKRSKITLTKFGKQYNASFDQHEVFETFQAASGSLKAKPKDDGIPDPVMLNNTEGHDFDANNDWKCAHCDFKFQPGVETPPCRIPAKTDKDWTS